MKKNKPNTKFPKTHKGFKFSLRTTPRQREALNCFIEGCNLIYNKGIAVQQESYEIYKKYIEIHGKEKAKSEKVQAFLYKNHLIMKYKVWRAQQDQEGILLRKTPTIFLVQTLIDLDHAFQAFYKKNARFPTEKLNNNYGSFRVICSPKSVQQDGLVLEFPEKTKKIGQIKIPFLGKLSYYNSRHVPGKLKNFTVSREGDRYFVSIQNEEDETDEVSMLPSVGIDFGIKPFITLSNGSIYKGCDAYRKAEKRISMFTNLLRNKLTKGSANYKKVQLEFEKFHIKLQDKRKDYLDKLSFKIAEEFGTVYIPDIKITDWDRPTTKKDLEEQSTKSLVTKGIRKIMRDYAWEKFTRMLEYKLKERGGRLVKVPVDELVNRWPEDFLFMRSNGMRALYWMQEGEKLSKEIYKCH